MPKSDRNHAIITVPDNAIVRVEDLHKVYGTGNTAVVALDHVNLSIRRAEFVAIMGPSGCGKSTLLHLLGGLDRPTSGRVLVDDIDLGTLNDDALSILRRERIGFVFQFFNLIPVLSAAENVELPLMLAGQRTNHQQRNQLDAGSRAREWLSRVGLGDRTGSRPDQLSGGQQQRVALARALVADPALVLADEPTGNLDSRSADEMLQLLRKTADDWGRTVVMVTHDARMAAYADRIVFMKDGTIVDDAQLGGERSVDDVLRRAEASA
jgi:putative ABC transport system ATP-binding protein